MSWKENLAFHVPATEHTVHGKLFKFYPISSRLIFKLKDFGRDVARAVTVLFENRDRDAGSIMRDFTDEKTGERGTETNLQPVSENIANFRTRERQRAAVELTDTFLKESSKALIGHLLANSLRDEFPREIQDKEAIEVVDALDIVALREMFVGVIKANEGVFGPLAKRVSTWTEETLSKTMANQAEEVTTETDTKNSKKS